jgi:hypothetical protein
MFYMISGVQRLWQIFRLNPLTVAPSPWSLRADFRQKAGEQYSATPIAASARRKSAGDGHQIDEFV